MKRYELTLLVSPDSSEKELEETVNKIKEFISIKQGEVKEIKKPTRRNLGYLVKKREEALLSILIFSLKETALNELNLSIKNMPNVLRHVIVKKEKEKMISHKRRMKREKPRQKADITEIDQKIDEILKES